MKRKLYIISLITITLISLIFAIIFGIKYIYNAPTEYELFIADNINNLKHRMKDSNSFSINSITRGYTIDSADKDNADIDSNNEILNTTSLNYIIVNATAKNSFNANVTEEYILTYKKDKDTGYRFTNDWSKLDKKTLSNDYSEKIDVQSRGSI